jgi:hypothetical protein
MIVPLTYPVPPQPLLEKAFSFTGDARYFALFWEPYGDEAMLTDGRTTCTTFSQPYLDYTRFLSSLGFNARLGDCEHVADDWLVIDRQERILLLAPAKEAQHLLAQQWPEVQALKMSPEDLEQLWVFLAQFLDHLPEVSAEDLQRKYQENQKAWRCLRKWISAERRKLLWRLQ